MSEQVSASVSQHVQARKTSIVAEMPVASRRISDQKSNADAVRFLVLSAKALLGKRSGIERGASLKTNFDVSLLCIAD